MLQKNILFLLCLLAGLCSCKKYLQVQPQGSYSEEQVYASAGAMQQALNGLYINLADTALYGQNLTMTTIELLGQRYQPSNSGNGILIASYFTNYLYNDARVQAVFEGLWKKAYSTILAANLFIARANEATARQVVTAGQGQQLVGEAVAIRAMMHFDLLRLFGPIYPVNANVPAIPYYTEADGHSQPLLTATQVMEKVLADFNTAATLLAADPVITQGVVNNNNFYYGMRNQRMNYYAVKGLLARAYLWAGNKQQAHDQALEVITQGEKWFPWTAPAVIQTLQDNPDRIFSSEVLLSVYNPKMYTTYTGWFSEDLKEAVNTAEPTRLRETFEDIANDYRYNENTWRARQLSKKCFYKFADVTDPLKTFRFLQPLLRKSEMYYILAETETDSQQALGYLNKVRYNRNLVNLTNASTLQLEIAKEYRKEFWGEGQLFFYYKRNNASLVPSGQSAYYSVAPAYVVPLPLSETTPR